ncbi:hypothetical protein FKM82_018992 [Ascaphus truei]
MDRINDACGVQHLAASKPPPAVCRHENPPRVRWTRTFKDGARVRARTAKSQAVRLFWPKSKSFDHMYREAADLLNNFPVQATISFYDDSDSDSDSEEESSEEEHDSGFESE